MDDVACAARATTPPSSSPRAPSRDEPATSPIRKKPRLDDPRRSPNASIPTDDPAALSILSSPQQPSTSSSSSSDTVAAPADPSTDHSSATAPGKLILNLRPTKHTPFSTNGGAPRAAMDAAAPAHRRDVLHPTQYMDVTGASTTFNRSDPPVVDIPLDDDGGGGGGGGGDAELEPHSAEVALFLRFPGVSASHNPEDALRDLIDRMEPNGIGISLQELGAVGDWIHEWLEQFSEKRSSWRDLYSSNMSFWHSLGIFFLRFTARAFPMRGPKYGTADQHTIVVDSVGLYLRLCCHIVSHDFESLCEGVKSGSPDLRLPHLRHLRNLTALLRFTDEPAVWRELAKNFRVDTRAIRQQIFEETIQEPTIINLVHLTAVISAHFGSSQHLRMSIVHSLTAVHVLLRRLRIARDVQSPGDGQSPDLAPAFRKAALDASSQIHKAVAQTVEQQNSAIPADLYRSIVSELKILIYEAAQANKEADNGSSEADATLRCISAMNELYLKFITKGRMELRVQGVVDFGLALVQLHESNANDRDTFGQALESTLEFLSKNRVIEYLAGVDSHPELTSRAANIFGLSLVNYRWSLTQTQAVFATIRNGQDPHKVTTVASILRDVLKYATAEVLKSFVLEIEEIPASAFSTEVMCLLSDVIDYLLRKDQALELYRCLLRVAITVCDPVAASRAPHSDMACLVGERLAHVDKTLGNESERLKLFASCASSILDLSATSTGAIVALSSMLTNRNAGDVVFLLSETDALANICENLVLYTKDANHRRHEPPDYRFIARLKSLRWLLSASPRDKVSPELRSRIWDSLVGEQAVNDAHRAEAWKMLSSMCTGPYQDDSIADAMVHEQLPTLPSELFATGAVDFVTAAAKQRFELLNPQAADEGRIVPIPLENLFWKFILETPYEREAVSNLAIRELVAFYTNDHLVSRLSSSAISGRHAALVEKTLDSLRDATTELSQASTQGSEAAIVQLKFARTLQFLYWFLQRVRTDPRFVPPQPSRQSPSPEPVRGTPIKGAQFSLRYQVFDPAESEVRELSIGRDNTCEELDQRLREMVPFRNFRLFQRGKPLDLMRIPRESVAAMETAGLLMIRKSGDAGASPPIHPDKIAPTVAESTVLARFEELYAYLKLDNGLDKFTYEFLQMFPYPDYAINLILSGDANKEALFPSEKSFKTMYELKSLKSSLKRYGGDPQALHTLVLRTTRFLLTVSCDPAVDFLHIDSIDRDWVTFEFFEALQIYVAELSRTDRESTLDVDPDTLVDKLIRLLHSYSNGDAQRLQHADSTSCFVYLVLRDLVVRDRAYWDAFVTHELCQPLHTWLLLDHPNLQFRDQIRMAVEYLLHAGAWPNQTRLEESRRFFWRLLMPSVAACVEMGKPSHQLFYLLAVDLIPSIGAGSEDNEPLEKVMMDWFGLLLSIQNSRFARPVLDDLVLGIASILHAAVLAELVPQRIFTDKELVVKIFINLLFPDIFQEQVQTASDEVTHAQPILEPLARHKVTELVLSLCRSIDNIEALMDNATFLTADQVNNEMLAFDEDRDFILRSSTGYSGLRNLTNTCYMNSLLSQLFMNDKFRGFMLKVPSVNTISTRLVEATKQLFTFMSLSQRKFADTMPFASAVVPYDAAHIDVSVQMDVDEFYNLLSDRWESQMPTEELRTEFRSLFGGEIITQVKSLDCEHVSERTEPYMAISCDVKGKYDLQQSLQSYIEGDAMEGDNKYKCESCGGRFVNAVKRTCLKQIPDSLIFHLKRFDFDLVTFQRNKINDYFNFPIEVDMAPYKYETVNETHADAGPDIFDLVGVLVHSGTAEAGHYYSFIKDPRGSNKWMEFNDTDVTEFDPNKIPDHCYGGSNNYGMKFAKMYSAYMLFYQRRESPTQQPTAAADRCPDQDKAMIQRDNDLATRWYCLLDKSYAFFIKESLGRLKLLNDGRCSANHRVEKAAIELALDYLNQIASRSKDSFLLEESLPTIEKHIFDCSECCLMAAEWFCENGSAMADLILRCPSQDTRNKIAATIFGMVKILRDELDGKTYGVEVAKHDISECEYHEQGILPRLILSLRTESSELSPYCHRWDQLFFLLYRIGDLGVGECRVLLEQEIFSCASLVMFMSEPVIRIPAHYRQTFWTRNVEEIMRFKRQPCFVNVIHLVEVFLDHLEAWSGDGTPGGDQGLLSEDERRLIESLNPEDNTLAFLIKAMDGWEVNEEPWAPWKFVRFFVKGAPRKVMATIELTLARAIADFADDNNLMGFRTAQEFFRVCPERSMGAQILEYAAQQTCKLEEEGGQAAIEFFTVVANLQEVQCSRDAEEQPFLVPVLGSLPKWASSLLTMNDLKVRIHATELMQGLLLAPLWQALQSGCVRPGAADHARNRALGLLFARCKARFVHMVNNEFPRGRITALWDVMSACQQWYKRIASNEQSAEVWQVEDVDASGIVAEHKRLVARWEAHDVEEEDEGTANTDEASDGEIDSNMTDQFQVQTTE